MNCTSGLDRSFNYNYLGAPQHVLVLLHSQRFPVSLEHGGMVSVSSLDSTILKYLFLLIINALASEMMDWVF